METSRGAASKPFVQYDFERFALCDSSLTRHAICVMGGSTSSLRSSRRVKAVSAASSAESTRASSRTRRLRRATRSRRRSRRRHYTGRPRSAARCRCGRRQAQGAQHVGALAAGLRARRARRDRDAAAEGEDQRLRFRARRSRRGGCPGSRVFDATVHLDAVEIATGGPRAAGRAARARAPASPGLERVRRATRAASPKPDDAGHVQRARPQPLLLPAAFGLRREAEARPRGPCARRARPRPWGRTSCGPTGS